MTALRIDLNCDLGEGCEHDADLMPLITSANIACGFHAGDPQIASATLEMAAAHGVHAGAHPGFADREHFGRRELKRSEEEIFQDCIYQVGGLIALARSLGTRIHYIKAHGALYNMACRDDAYARPLVRAAEFFCLPILGLPRSRLQALAAGKCRFVAEGFADRRYTPDGTLVPRTQPNAFIETVEEAIIQVKQLIAKQNVETICVHGDNPRALEFVRQLRSALLEQGFEIKPFT